MIKVSLDLGHCFSSVGFVHGDKIMALKPKEERDGRKVKLLEIITEPFAAALANADILKNKGTNTIIYDLGGGTFDTVMVQATGDEKMPCKVLGQDGRAVGGYDWDVKMQAIIEEKLTVVLGSQADSLLAKKKDLLLEEARKLKEELSEVTIAETSLNIQGSYYEVKVTREEFEKRTENLLQQTIDAITHLAEKMLDILSVTSF